jgi:hypothetical protein
MATRTVPIPGIERPVPGTYLMRWHSRTPQRLQASFLSPAAAHDVATDCLKGILSVR